MRKLLLPAAAALIAGVVAALAANTTFFTSLGDIVFPFSPPTAAGLNGSIGDPVRGGMAPVNGNLAYTKGTPGTGFSYTFGNFQADMILAPAGTLAAGYITLAQAPVDGAKNCLFSTTAITQLNVCTNSGAGANNCTQTAINNAATALAANAKVCYTYSLSNTTWDRSN